MAEVKMDLDSFKPNSNKYKREMEEKEKKKIEKVVKGGVITKKPTFSKKFADVFLSEDADTVKGYIIFDVLLPAIKNMVADMVTEGINVLLFGSRGAKRGVGQKTNYNSMSKESYKSNARYTESYKQRKFNYDEIILESRGEAENVIDSLLEIISVYGQATVGDLYSLVDISSNDFMNEKWGWLDLKDSGVRRVREGYLIVLPKTTYLE